MIVAILGITGFQVYWLEQNYQKEKKNLAIKTESSFRETMTQLQVSKLKLDAMMKGKTGVQFIVSDNMDGHKETRIEIPRGPGKEEIMSTINVLTERLKDSLREAGKQKLIISMDNTQRIGDSLHIKRALPEPGLDKGYFLDLLYGVDSLQDSIKVAEVKTAYSAQLKKQKIDLDFTITRLDTAIRRNDNNRNYVTVGLARPVTYKLSLGNSFPYLLRQLAQPILFSLLLMTITLLSFILLYRNLLKQQRLAALKNEFISNITHELKTPIATVGVAIEALKNFNAIQDPARTREYLDISSNELQRLSLLVDKVLKLSMLEKKEVDLKYEYFNLEDVVNEVLSSLKLQFEKYRARVTVTKEGDLHLKADRLHLLSIVFNLLDNALKYSKDEPVINIDMKADEREVVLSVTDNGIGIPPEYREKVFEKFFRVPHGDTHNAKGYGLGLSYVAQVVQKHGGEVTVTGDGNTIFTVKLPKG